MSEPLICCHPIHVLLTKHELQLVLYCRCRVQSITLRFMHFSSDYCRYLRLWFRRACQCAHVSTVWSWPGKYDWPLFLADPVDCFQTFSFLVFSPSGTFWSMLFVQHVNSSLPPPASVVAYLYICSRLLAKFVEWMLVVAPWTSLSAHTHLEQADRVLPSSKLRPQTKKASNYFIV